MKFKLLAIILVGFTGLGFFFRESNDKLNLVPALDQKKIEIALKLGPYFKKKELPQEARIDWNGESQDLRVEYTLDTEIQHEAEKLFKSYRPDYAVVVAMDASTGRILTMASYVKNAKDDLDENLSLKAQFPAASLFKMVTASAALESLKVTPDSSIYFTGSNHSLYKRNVFTDFEPRRSRSLSLKEAFAKSVNTVFGRLGVKILDPNELKLSAQRLLFNTLIHSDLPIEISKAHIPLEANFEMAEVASGFYPQNLLSPLHAALMAAAPAEDGNLPSPFVVERLMSKDGAVLYEAKPERLTMAMKSETAAALRSLMRETISGGTSRKFFRAFLRDHKYSDVEIGGKTGSLTGTSPKGRCDWFMGYGRRGPQRIALAALTVNKEKWTIRSSTIAEKIFRTYFQPSRQARTPLPPIAKDTP
ncbi:MAG: penicillin-binding protein [Bdellovibrionales bacterium]|nr:penicillin-binding protein [Bdellovibrionales bacterium]